MEENVLNQVKFIKNENDINLFLFSIYYLVTPEKVNISGRILNFSTNNYQFDY